MNTNTNTDFHVKEFYDEYSQDVIGRPGYPARAQFKSSLMWEHFEQDLIKEIGIIKRYADVGGCFGFGANALRYHIERTQGAFPDVTAVFELSEYYAKIGKSLFPKIEFCTEDILEMDSTFDLVSLFDVLEHVINPGEFLNALSTKARYILMKTPTETKGDWLGGGKLHDLSGATHPEGHVNFFTPRTLIDLLETSGFDVVGQPKYLSPLMHPKEERVLMPEFYYGRNKAKRIIRELARISIPNMVFRKMFGRGDIICVARSKNI